MRQTTIEEMIGNQPTKMKKWGYKVNLMGKRKNDKARYFWHVYYEIEGKIAARKKALKEEKGEYESIEVLSVEKLK